MLNKLAFNNLVISNKVDIQQSRVQTIHKLVHKIRKLKTQLEKYPNDMKCKERIRKSTETMELLKKIKRGEIMKKILLADKPPVAVITNGLATPEEVAIALLSLNKVMLGLIKKFKTELLLEESKKELWQKVLMETSKRRQKKERTGEKRHKRLEMKKKKAIERKRQDWLEQNCLRTENVGDSNISATGSWNVEELDSEVLENIKQKRKDVGLRPLEKPKETALLNRKLNMNTEKGRKSINELDTVGIETSLSEIENKEDEKSLVADPFFITNSGENYLSSAVCLKKDQSANEDSEEEKKDLHIIKLNNSAKKYRDLKNRFQKSQEKNFNDFEIKYKKDKGKTNMWPTNKRPNNIAFENKEAERETNGKNLHPSWAAKQKLKPVITAFQGKKIKFDDDTESSSQVATHQNKSNQLFNNSNADQETLHPSWAAKQKLKPTIAAFQGKKITFDNED